MKLLLPGRHQTARVSSFRVGPNKSGPRRATKMDTAASLTVYTCPQTRGRLVEWYLAERDIPYVKKVLDFKAGDFKSDWYLKINPLGKVPALTDGDLKLFESGALLLYIADKYDPTIKTAEERAIAAQWVLFANSTIAPLVYQLLYNPSEKGEEKWAPIFQFLEAHLAGRDWLVGSELTVADVAVGSAVGIWQTTPIGSICNGLAANVYMDAQVQAETGLEFYFLSGAYRYMLLLGKAFLNVDLAAWPAVDAYVTRLKGRPACPLK